jgi:hypothetical protein
MKSKEEIKKWLLENCVDSYGDLHLGDLDFTDFNGNIYLGKMKVKDDVIQGWQKVGVDGNIIQDDLKRPSITLDYEAETNRLTKENQELKEKLDGYETLLLYIAKELKEGRQNDR